MVEAFKTTVCEETQGLPICLGFTMRRFKGNDTLVHVLQLEKEL